MRLRPDPKDLNVMTPAPERPDLPHVETMTPEERSVHDALLPIGDFGVVARHVTKALIADGWTFAAAPVTDAGLREAAQQMWFAHTEDESFRPDGPLSADPYGEFEVVLRAALSRQADRG
jgi:hypothetical protein